MRTLVTKYFPPVVIVLVSIVGGWQATYLIDTIPRNMPYAVDMFIRFCLSVTGHEELANPDDMAVLALVLYWIVSAILIGIVLSAAYSAIRHRRRSKSNPS